MFLPKNLKQTQNHKKLFKNFKNEFWFESGVMGNYITIRTYTFVRLSVVITKIQTKNFEPKYTIKIYGVFFMGSLACLRGRKSCLCICERM